MNSNYSLVKNTKVKKKSKPKLGFILKEADIVSESQVQIALEYQSKFPFFRLGEIISIQGWTDSRTCDFFASQWHQLVELEYRKPLGYYLQQAGLLEKSDIESILSEQQSTKYRFGTIAAQKGYVKTSTVDFFLKHLFPEELGSSSVRTQESLLRSKQRQEKYYFEAVKRKKLSKVRSNNN